MKTTPAKTVIYSIGHSSRTLGEFISILERRGIETVADVRSYPASRRYPHFGRERLFRALAERGINYLWMPGLGGRREGGFAEYAKTTEFGEALDELIETASRTPTAFMCSELRWRECHRGFISEALAGKGLDVVHVYDALESEPHSALPLNPARP